MKYYPREIEPVIIRAAKQFRVVVLTGARQTGKSTLLQHLFGKTHQYVSLDNPRDLKLAQDDPELFFHEYKSPLILDEIQYAPQLLSFIKMRVDQSQKRGQFLITGSQQFTLMKGLQETLAGRAVLFQLMPMSITEGAKLTRNYHFRGLVGSYPELVAIQDMNPDHWFSSYLSTYIEKDVQLHYHLEKITFFRDFIFLLAARCSQVLNYQSLGNDLGVSVMAIKSWIKILEASQIIYLLKPFYVNLGSRITKSPKVYFTDIGLVSYVTGNRNSHTLMRGQQAGALFENFVIQELLKYYSNIGQKPPLYYYRTNNGLEIDIIIEKKTGEITPCEIKLTKSPHNGMIQAMERFRKLNEGKNIQITDGALISLSPKSFPLSRNTRAYNVIEFLNQYKHFCTGRWK